MGLRKRRQWTPAELVPVSFGLSLTGFLMALLALVGDVVGWW